MPQFRKKPVVIEAMQWDGENHEQIAAAMVPLGALRPFHVPFGDQLFIATREGTMAANIGDWIIRGVQGEFYPCKPDIFAVTYESADLHSFRHDLTAAASSADPQETPQ